MLEAGYLEGRQGPFFYVLHSPAEEFRGAVLYAHPFAEELNKSRRMAALQARAFAAAGYAVLLPDHYGCGDSSGDFGDARWETWVQDLALCADWLGRRVPGPLYLWGLRTGCLLIGELARERATAAAGTIFWQPVTSGEQYFAQFLRLRVAASMMEGAARETTSGLRERLAAGEALEVAGYRLDPVLAAAVQRTRLEPPRGGMIHWFEIAAATDAGIAPAARRVLDTWVQEGIAVEPRVVAGDPFWATQEICEVDALIQQTTRLLTEAA